MRRHLIGFIFAVLMFVAGCWATRVYRKHYEPYRWVAFPKSKHYGAFHSLNYEAWDGEQLELYCHTFDSEQNAQDWFSERLSDATQILERSPFLYDSGNQVGDRAVVVYPPFGASGTGLGGGAAERRKCLRDLRGITAPSLRAGEAA